MSGKIEKCCLLHDEKNLDTESRFTKSYLWEPTASKRSAIHQTKNNIVALLPFLKLSVKFQRNRLWSVQDIKPFSVRPPPKFCLINLFMSSLSPAALTKSKSKHVGKVFIIKINHRKGVSIFRYSHWRFFIHLSSSSNKQYVMRVALKIATGEIL